MEMMQTFHTATVAIGGLALFIHGMKAMSDGLKETAGAKLRAALDFMTRNRFSAILTGLGVTALIQSSSATSVLTVGFVNAGLLSLEQAIGVIFGANVGTTVTGQIVSLKIGDVALPAVTVGVIGLMVAKRRFYRGIWRTVLGFGFLFFGMEMMGRELKALADQPGFVEFFSLFDCTPSASGRLPVGCVLGAIVVGTLCTMLVQSSSATIGITIALAEAGVINIWTAVPIVLGDNIGTTVTAGLAAIGTNANAKRTALAHALFNLFGTGLLILTFDFVCANKAGVRAPAFFQLVDAVSPGNVFAGESPGRHVAMAHTLFNVTNVVVLAAFIPALARLCRKLVRERDESRTLTLEPRLLAAPTLALQAATEAIADMTRRSWTIASVALNCRLGKAAASPESIEAAENEVDGMRDQITAYLVQVSQRKLSAREARMIPELILCANDAERISDLALKVYRKGLDAGTGAAGDGTLPRAAQVAASVRRFAHATIEALRAGKAPAFDPKEVDGGIGTAIRDATRGLWESASANPRTGAVFADLSVFKCLADISRHIANIAARARAIAATD